MRQYVTSFGAWTRASFPGTGSARTTKQHPCVARQASCDADDVYCSSVGSLLVYIPGSLYLRSREATQTQWRLMCTVTIVTVCAMHDLPAEIGIRNVDFIILMLRYDRQTMDPREEARGRTREEMAPGQTPCSEGIQVAPGARPGVVGIKPTIDAHRRRRRRCCNIQWRSPLDYM